MGKQTQEFGKKKMAHGTYRCQRKPNSPKCRKKAK